MRLSKLLSKLVLLITTKPALTCSPNIFVLIPGTAFALRHSSPPPLFLQANRTHLSTQQDTILTVRANIPSHLPFPSTNLTSRVFVCGLFYYNQHLARFPNIFISELISIPVLFHGLYPIWFTNLFVPAFLLEPRKHRVWPAARYLQDSNTISMD